MSRTVRSIPLVAVALAALLVSLPAAAPQNGAIPLDVTALLDVYARGDRDQAVAAVARVGKPQAQALRTTLTDTGHSWAHAVQTELRPRLLAAAAFALELEAARIEHGDWTSLNTSQCNPRCTIEWARTLLRARGPADDAERAWFTAAFALVAGVRDWTFVYSPLSVPGPRTRISGLALQALTRFPNDPRFKLTRAMAIASRYDITDEMDAPRDGQRTGPVQSTTAAPLIVIRDNRGDARIAEQRSQQVNYAKAEMTALVPDAHVGGEAQMRLAYLHWRLGEYDDAIATARRASASATTTADQKYVAGMIAGQAAQAAGQFDDAEKSYGDALALRPGSQSASIGLAALRFYRGDAASAYDLIEQARTARPHDDDPWRLFLYGDHPHLAERIAALRAAVRR